MTKPPGARTCTVLLADDHAILRQGLKTMIEQQPGMKVVAEAPDGAEAVELARTHKPDMVIMDIHMPRLNGMEAAARIMELGIDTRIIALSMFPKKRFVEEMLKAGARGYILKDCAFDELIQAIKAVMDGERYLSKEISQVVIENFVSGLDGSPKQTAPLTPREREVLQRLAEGKSSREIAAELNCSHKTVDVHRHRIMQKLGVGSVAELVKYAISEGLTAM